MKNGCDCGYSNCNSCNKKLLNEIQQGQLLILAVLHGLEYENGCLTIRPGYKDISVPVLRKFAGHVNKLVLDEDLKDFPRKSLAILRQQKNPNRTTGKDGFVVFCSPKFEGILKTLGCNVEII